MYALIAAEERNLTEQLIPMVIGIIAGLAGWIVNQLVVKRWESFRAENRAIALERLERAYQPLYYLTGILLLEMKNKNETRTTKQQISAILEKNGHLLSEEAQNLVIAYLFMNNPSVERLETERLQLAREIELLKNLIYPNYKLYREYYTTDLLGKARVFWQEMQYKIFTMFLVVGSLLAMGYLASMYLSAVLVILFGYVLIGGVAYIVRDHLKAKRLRGGPAPVQQDVAPLPAHRGSQIDQKLQVPSKEFLNYSNDLLSLSYPANFNPSTPIPKGEVVFSLMLEGFRNDSNIFVDMRPAKKLTLEKVIEQNRNFYKPTSIGQTTIDGNKATFLTYSMTKDVTSRAYFVVKKEKICRVIINYYKPSEKDFLPAFEKTIASLKIN